MKDHSAPASSAASGLRCKDGRDSIAVIVLWVLDADYADYMCLKLGAFGYDLLVVDSLNTLVDTVTRHRPLAVLVDESVGDDRWQLVDTLNNLTAPEQTPIPCVFLNLLGNLDSRLAAVRAGASAYFTKPVDMKSLHEKLIGLTRDVGVSRGRVLLVDDCELVSEGYKGVLQGAGFDVQLIHRPILVLGELRLNPPDLILMDIVMPEINGLELAAVIRQFDEYLHIPIIFLTAEHTMNNRLASMRLGGDGFLAKPVDSHFLIETVTTNIERHKALESGAHRLKAALRDLHNFKYAQDQHSIVSVTDRNGFITDVNENFCNVSGYHKSELIGKNHRILKSDHHPSLFYDDLWRTISHGQVWHGQIKNKRKSGDFYWVSSTIVPILDDFGVPEKYIAVRTDITHIKKLEVYLQENQSRLYMALDATSTGLWEWNLHQNVSFYSKRWLALLGYELNAQIDWPLIVHPDDLVQVTACLYAHLRGETPIYTSEHRLRNAKGEWEWVYECGRMMVGVEKDEYARLIGTMQVINDRKAMEVEQEQLKRQLVQASKMEAMGHLTSGVAHDFNNLLGGILGYTELASAMLERDTPVIEKLKRYLSEVNMAGVRAKELVAQMLMFSRLGPSQSQEATSVRLLPILKEVTGLLHSSIPSTIAIRYHVSDPELQAVIQPVHLHQILLNLGINARDAMGLYGRLEFNIDEIHIDHCCCAACNADFNGDFVQITVKDTGSGIPPHVLSNIFHPFFTTKDVGKGTGMGLSVVHGVVHSLNGHILVESSPDSGTAIHILLPKVIEMAGDVVEKTSKYDYASNALAGVRALVVDDESSIASLLWELLTSQGATVTAHTNSVSALKSFVTDPKAFDILITDQTMPELSGVDMALKMRDYRADLPIILCTGYSEYATQDTVSGLGHSAFMTKPLDIPALIGHIQRLLAEKYRIPVADT